MRPLWTGGISFGLIYIPVNLYSAATEVTLDLDMLEARTLAPIRYARVSTATGEEVPWDQIVKGYEYKKGDYVVLHDEDFAKADVRKSHTIDIQEFVDAETIDTKYFEKPYYLEPTAEARKTYALLVEALKKSGKIGVGEFVLREREHLVALKPDGNMLLLMQMRYEDEIRPVKELDIPDDVHVSAKEIDLALSLIDQMSDTFEPKQFEDNYIDELKEIIEKKAHHQPVKANGEKPKPTKVKDLMADLKLSLEKIKTKRTK